MTLKQGHALTSTLTSWPKTPKYPFLTLLISGGHTLLLLATSSQSFQIIATTRDESIGRTFDKVSKLLGLKWTSLGPGDALEQFCAEPQVDHPSIPPFPRPLLGQLAYSFSAFHSHVTNFMNEHGGHENVDVLTRRALARAFQSAAVGHLEEKLILGLDLCKKKGIYIQDIVVSGGVASNQFLRDRYANSTCNFLCICSCLETCRLRTCLLEYDKDTHYELSFPPPHLCTG